MIARAPVHVAYMESIMPPEGAALRKQMNALKALDEGKATQPDLDYIKGPILQFFTNAQNLKNNSGRELSL